MKPVKTIHCRTARELILALWNLPDEMPTNITVVVYANDDGSKCELEPPLLKPSYVAFENICSCCNETRFLHPNDLCAELFITCPHCDAVEVTKSSDWNPMPARPYRVGDTHPTATDAPATTGAAM